MTSTQENLESSLEKKANKNLWRNAEEKLLGEDSNPNSLFICSIHEGQRPLKGVPGALDWRLRGFLSRFVINGKITGKFGEAVYIPFFHQGSVRHLLVVGLGSKEEIQSKPKNSSAQLVSGLIRQKAIGMKFQSLVISQSSFPFLEKNSFSQEFNVEFTQ